MTVSRTGVRLFLGICFLVAAAALVSGCAKPKTGRIDLQAARDGDVVGAVKRGTLSFDTGVTVGNAFDNYGGFVVKWNKWDHFQTQNRRNIVEFRGHMDLRQANVSDAAIDRLEKVILVTQFAANVDGGLEVRYMGYILKAVGGLQKEYNISKGNHDLYLKAIYGNYKFSNARYEFIIENMVLN